MKLRVHDGCIEMDGNTVYKLQDGETVEGDCIHEDSEQALLVIKSEGGITILGVANDQSTPIDSKLTFDGVGQLTFSPNGEKVAVVENSGGDEVLWLGDFLKLGQLKQVTDWDFKAISINWESDGIIKLTDDVREGLEVSIDAATGKKISAPVSYKIKHFAKAKTSVVQDVSQKIDGSFNTKHVADITLSSDIDKLWELRTDDPYKLRFPVGKHGICVIPSGDYDLFAVDLRSCNEIWRRENVRSESLVHIIHDFCYCSQQNDKGDDVTRFFSYKTGEDAGILNGNIRVQGVTDDRIFSTYEVLSYPGLEEIQNIQTSKLTDHGRLYTEIDLDKYIETGIDDGGTIIYSSHDDSEKYWSISGKGFSSNLFVTDSVAVYELDNENQLAALSLKDGSKQWTSDIRIGFHKMFFVSDEVFFSLVQTDEVAYLTCYSLDSGEELWSCEIPLYISNTSPAFLCRNYLALTAKADNGWKIQYRNLENGQVDFELPESYDMILALALMDDKVVVRADNKIVCYGEAK